MSATLGKILREDYGPFNGRGRDWPSYPQGLHPLYPYGGSTDVVCARCGNPTGLRYDPVNDEFVHPRPIDCVPVNASLR